MKKFLFTSLLLLTALSLAACSAGTAQGSSRQAGSAESAREEGFTLEGEVNGEINISCYDFTYESLLNEAAEKFESKYPGTTVNVNLFSTPPEIKTMEKDGMKMAIITTEADPQAESDYIFKSGNDIMSGQGADIYAIDVLPYYKYVQGGYLEDLSKYMDADTEFNTSDYKSNILNAVKYEGGQYIMPLSYSFSILTYDPEILETAAEDIFNGKEAMSLAQVLELTTGFADEYNAAREEPVKLINYGKENLFSTLFKNNYKSFVDIENKRCDFNSGSFTDLLNMVTAYADNGYISDSVFGMMKKGGGEAGSGAPEMPDFEDVQMRLSTAYMLGLQGNQSLFNMLNKDAEVTRMFMSSSSASAENHEIGALSANDFGDVEADVFNMFGMNSNSKNKRTAWEFIKFLLSDEMQSSLNIISLPVNNNARAENMKLEVVEELFVPVEEREAKELTPEQQAILDEYAGYIEDYSNQINAVTLTDSKIMSIVMEETNLFFTGEKSAEEAASSIQSKVSLYLNE